MSQDVKIQIESRYTGFLETSETSKEILLVFFTGSYLHWTARDFVESKEYCPKVLVGSDPNGFHPDEHLANAALLTLKSLARSSELTSANSCAKLGIAIQRRKGVVPVTYLNPVLRPYMYSTPAPHIPVNNRIGLFMEGYLDKVAPGSDEFMDMLDYLAAVFDNFTPDEFRSVFRGCRDTFKAVKKF